MHQKPENRKHTLWAKGLPASRRLTAHVCTHKLMFKITIRRDALRPLLSVSPCHLCIYIRRAKEWRSQGVHCSAVVSIQ